MRQAGVLAAAGIIALTEMTERLAIDHENAQILAKGLAQIEELGINPQKVMTNIVIFNTEPLGLTASEFAQKAAEKNVKVSLYGPMTIRLVTHNDVSREDVLYAVDVLTKLIKEALALS